MLAAHVTGVLRQATAHKKKTCYSTVIDAEQNIKILCM